LKPIRLTVMGTVFEFPWRDALLAFGGLILYGLTITILFAIRGNVR